MPGDHFGEALDITSTFISSDDARGDYIHYQLVVGAPHGTWRYRLRNTETIYEEDVDRSSVTELPFKPDEYRTINLYTGTQCGYVRVLDMKRYLGTGGVPVTVLPTHGTVKDPEWTIVNTDSHQDVAVEPGNTTRSDRIQLVTGTGSQLWPRYAGGEISTYGRAEMALSPNRNKYANSDFGHSISISDDGNTFAVSAPNYVYDDDLDERQYIVQGSQVANSKTRGAVFIFTKRTHSPTTGDLIPERNKYFNHFYNYWMTASTNETILNANTNATIEFQPRDRTLGVAGRGIHSGLKRESTGGNTYLQYSENHYFGYSISLSGDGKTLVVGDPNYSALVNQELGDERREINVKREVGRVEVFTLEYNSSNGGLWVSDMNNSQAILGRQFRDTRGGYDTAKVGTNVQIDYDGQHMVVAERVYQDTQNITLNFKVYEKSLQGTWRLKTQMDFPVFNRQNVTDVGIAPYAAGYYSLGFAGDGSTIIGNSRSQKSVVYIDDDINKLCNREGIVVALTTTTPAVTTTTTIPPTAPAYKLCAPDITHTPEMHFILDWKSMHLDYPRMPSAIKTPKITYFPVLHQAVQDPETLENWAYAQWPQQPNIIRTFPLYSEEGIKDYLKESTNSIPFRTDHYGSDEVLSLYSASFDNLDATLHNSTFWKTNSITPIHYKLSVVTGKTYKFYIPYTAGSVNNGIAYPQFCRENPYIEITGDSQSGTFNEYTDNDYNCIPRNQSMPWFYHTVYIKIKKSWNGMDRFITGENGSAQTYITSDGGLQIPCITSADVRTNPGQAYYIHNQLELFISDSVVDGDDSCEVLGFSDTQPTSYEIPQGAETLTFYNGIAPNGVAFPNPDAYYAYVNVMDYLEPCDNSIISACVWVNDQPTVPDGYAPTIDRVWRVEPRLSRTQQSLNPTPELIERYNPPRAKDLGCLVDMDYWNYFSGVAGLASSAGVDPDSENAAYTRPINLNRINDFLIPGLTGSDRHYLFISFNTKHPFNYGSGGTMQTITDGFHDQRHTLIGSYIPNEILSGTNNQTNDLDGITIPSRGVANIATTPEVAAPTEEFDLIKNDLKFRYNRENEQIEMFVDMFSNGTIDPCYGYTNFEVTATSREQPNTSYSGMVGLVQARDRSWIHIDMNQKYTTKDEDCLLVEPFYNKFGGQVPLYSSELNKQYGSPSGERFGAQRVGDDLWNFLGDNDNLITLRLELKNPSKIVTLGSFRPSEIKALRPTMGPTPNTPVSPSTPLVRPAITPVVAVREREERIKNWTYLINADSIYQPVHSTTLDNNIYQIYASNLPFNILGGRSDLFDLPSSNRLALNHNKNTSSQTLSSTDYENVNAAIDATSTDGYKITDSALAAARELRRQELRGDQLGYSVLDQFSSPIDIAVQEQIESMVITIHPDKTDNVSGQRFVGNNTSVFGYKPPNETILFNDFNTISPWQNQQPSTSDGKFILPVKWMLANHIYPGDGWRELALELDDETIQPLTANELTRLTYQIEQVRRGNQDNYKTIINNDSRGISTFRLFATNTYETIMNRIPYAKPTPFGSVSQQAAGGMKELVEATWNVEMSIDWGKLRYVMLRTGGGQWIPNERLLSPEIPEYTVHDAIQIKITRSDLVRYFTDTSINSAPAPTTSTTTTTTEEIMGPNPTGVVSPSSPLGARPTVMTRSTANNPPAQSGGSSSGSSGGSSGGGSYGY